MTTYTFLQTPLQPFQPDFQPSVGNLDVMVRPPLPDGRCDGAGMGWVDEQGPTPSDAALLELTLRAASRRAGSCSSMAESSPVRRIEHARVAREVGRWVAAVASVRAGAVPGGDRACFAGGGTVPPNLSAQQPLDTESLLGEWPSAVQAALREEALPGADIDLPLTDYGRVACALLDNGIDPTAGGTVHALHKLFSIYLDAREHPGLTAYEPPPPVNY